MTYQECLDYFYNQLPMFHRSGAAALKPNLENIKQLCHALGNPEESFQSVHIAGTNGKGSSSHMLAAVFQASGYKTGLYTSPHLKDFRERVRVNGELIEEEQVVYFVTQNRLLLDKIKPSFFELTVSLAFDYFARQKVDIAIIEVGLGGRLDSTNIINPEVCLITNIGNDHSDLLGDTLEAIAKEKAGIIKHQVPVVVGERQPEIEKIFQRTAEEHHSKICFASDFFKIASYNKGYDVFHGEKPVFKDLILDLEGPFQVRNLPGVLQTLEIVNGLGFAVTKDQIRQGLENTARLTGIRGRWQTLADLPKIICDTGHNSAALEITVAEIRRLTTGALHLVIGFVNDKDIQGMLQVLPKEAYYYFCSANVPRSMNAKELAKRAETHNLSGQVVPDPNDALAIARQNANPEDLIFVGGSTFVVAEITEISQ